MRENNRSALDQAVELVESGSEPGSFHRLELWSNFRFGVNGGVVEAEPTLGYAVYLLGREWAGWSAPETQD